MKEYVARALLDRRLIAKALGRMGNGARAKPRVPARQTALMYATIDAAAALQKLTEKLPGMAEVMKPDHPGMNTVDRRVVARSGRVSRVSLGC